MTDVVGTGTIELVADARKLRASIDEAKRSIRTLGEGQRDISAGASRSIDTYIGKLQQQNATFGKSNREIELYKLALRGASNEQIRTADTALRLRETQEKNAATIASLRSGFAAFGAIAVTASIAAAAAFDQLIKKAGDFQDIAEKIGDTGKNVASLSVAAEVGNLRMDALTTISNRLAKNLTGIDDESSAAGSAIAALGLNIEELQKKAPVERLVAIAEAFERFEGGDKSAAAIALLGKSGAEALPFLKELATGVGQVNILTEEQIKAADEYSDRQKKLAAEISLHAQAIATQALPILNEFRQAIADIAKDQDHAATISVVLNSALGGLVNIFQTIAVIGSDVVFVFKGIGRELGALFAQLIALQTFDFKGFGAIGKEVKEDAERARKELDKFQERVMQIGKETGKQVAKATKDAADAEIKNTTDKPKLDFIGAAAAKEQIQLIEAVARAGQIALEKNIGADVAATQARLASTQNLLASQRELERAEIAAIAKRVSAAQEAFTFEERLAKARGESSTKANLEMLQAGTKLYDGLIASSNAYYNVIKSNQEKILALDKQIADSRRSTASLLRDIDEKEFTPDQKAGSLRQRLLEGETNLLRSRVSGNVEEFQRLFAEQQRMAKEIADLGFTFLGKTFIEGAQAELEKFNATQKASAQSIANEAAKGIEAVQTQIAALKTELAGLSDKALSSIKVRADQESLDSLVRSIRDAVQKETFTVNLQPQLAGSPSVPSFAEGGVAGRGLALVGERGPELVRFMQPGQVYDAMSTRHILAAIGGMNVPAFASGGIATPDMRSTNRSADMVVELRQAGRQPLRLSGPHDRIQQFLDDLSQTAIGT